MKQFMRLLNISETAAVMCAVIGGMFALLLAAGTLVSALVFPFERPAAYALGLLLGCLLSAIKVVLLEKSLGSAVEREQGAARGYAGLMYMLRYLLTAAVLVLAFLYRDILGPVGAIIGVLSLQISAYIAGWIMKKRDA